MHPRSLVVSGLLAGTLLLAACGETDPTATGAAGAGSQASTSAATPADYNDADVAFVSGMAPHHEQAVEMAEILLSKDPSPEVTALAEQIRAAQGPEIEQLEQMLNHVGVESAGGHSGGHGASHGDGDTTVHAGMMSDAQLQELEQATGTAAERLFLEHMIEHHRGAVEAAETELADGTYPPALELAERIRASQTEEIVEMQELLAA